MICLPGLTRWDNHMTTEQPVAAADLERRVAELERIISDLLAKSRQAGRT